MKKTEPPIPTSKKYWINFLRVIKIIRTFSQRRNRTPFHHSDKGSIIRLNWKKAPTQTGALGHSSLYKQNAEELEAAKQYLTDNLNKGFIVPSSSPFASPILMARMPSGKLRFCVDYRKLNAISKKDRYPVPLIDELMERLNGAKIFTILDIRQGFHRIGFDYLSHPIWRIQVQSCVCPLE